MRHGWVGICNRQFVACRAVNSKRDRVGQLLLDVLVRVGGGYVRVRHQQTVPGWRLHRPIVMQRRERFFDFGVVEIHLHVAGAERMKDCIEHLILLRACQRANLFEQHTAHLGIEGLVAGRSVLSCQCWIIPKVGDVEVVNRVLQGGGRDRLLERVNGDRPRYLQNCLDKCRRDGDYAADGGSALPSKQLLGESCGGREIGIQIRVTQGEMVRRHREPAKARRHRIRWATPARAIQCRDVVQLNATDDLPLRDRHDGVVAQEASCRSQLIAIHQEQEILRRCGKASCGWQRIHCFGCVSQIG